MGQTVQQKAWGLIMASHEMGTPYTEDQSDTGGAPPSRNADIEAAAHRALQRVDPEQGPELAVAVEDIYSRYAEEVSVAEVSTSVEEMGGALEGGPDSVEWLRDPRGRKDGQ